MIVKLGALAPSIGDAETSPSTPPQGPAMPGLAAAEGEIIRWCPTYSGLSPQLYDHAPLGLSEQTLNVSPRDSVKV